MRRIGRLRVGRGGKVARWECGPCAGKTGDLVVRLLNMSKADAGAVVQTDYHACFGHRDALAQQVCADTSTIARFAVRRVEASRQAQTRLSLEGES